MNDKGKKIRVLIVDDIITFRKRFCEVLGSDEKIKIVGVAITGEEAVRLAISEKPDIILMDIMMENDGAGIDATRMIIEKLPNTKIIISTVLEDDEIVYSAFQMGAVDYILKNSKTDEVIEAVHAAYNNQSPIRPRIAEKIRGEFRKIRTYQDSIIFTINIFRQLTQAELDVLILLCEGENRKSIAYLRCIEPNTVKTHISNILKKFNKKSTNEVVGMIKKMQILNLLKMYN